ncbi:Arm DNA-binding domain-containing protein [Mucilaginibacter ginsenosidivorax]|uniref:Arm DNA-binding domain-containing protein n=1 Tax=Mucilaginibacter ginsenosidivorax TaxID=862126 RepID=A0A5B8W5Q7_9SPHI|nr:Arm DNA-binding domain-containing protein [Mucilaginibacter ginsenosidivorax]QEC78919.1 hypothetical protein FSB76_24310 [Mucilaginibacter ginsenosidivorax]
MKINFHLLFYLKKQKNYQDGTVAIYMRITVNGKRAEISAGRECDPTRWNARAGKGIGTKEDIRALNKYLESLQTKVKAAHQTLVDAGKIITAESLRDQFTGKEEKSRYLMEIIDTSYVENLGEVSILLEK